MFDLSLPVSELPILGYNENTDYFNQHYAQWEQEVLAKLQTLGYPLKLWPSGTSSAANFIRQWKGSGQPLYRAPMLGTVSKEPYTGPAVHPSLMTTFNTAFPIVERANFIITRGEDWWPYDKAFPCNDANSLMLSILYESAIRNPKVLEQTTERKRGRPRDDAAHAAKAEKSSRYQQWLADCEVYRAEVAEAEEAYSQARAIAEELRVAMNKIKVRGAPKWIP